MPDHLGLSACCGALLRRHEGEEGTQWFTCSACERPADAVPDPPVSQSVWCRDCGLDITGTDDGTGLPFCHECDEGKEHVVITNDGAPENYGDQNRRPRLGQSVASDPAMDQWVELLRLTTDLMLTTDAVMEVFTGHLNEQIEDRDAARAEIARRTVAYRDAREAVIAYARGVAER